MKTVSVQTWLPLSTVTLNVSPQLQGERPQLGEGSLVTCNNSDVQECVFVCGCTFAWVCTRVRTGVHIRTHTVTADRICSHSSPGVRAGVFSGGVAAKGFRVLWRVTEMSKVVWWLHSPVDAQKPLGGGR